MAPLPRRLQRLPPARFDASSRGLLHGRDVRRASSPVARLLGLAFLRELAAGAGLLLPRTRSIHTFGMCFPLTLVWLDGAGRVVRIDRRVPPRRVRACRAARAVVELPAAVDA
jgi:uncharacterized membrane protein (UPF0127 family)